MSSDNTQLPALRIPKGLPIGARKALRHWHEHRPRMYTELHDNGTLIETAVAADEAVDVDLEEIQESLEAEYDTPTAFVMAKRIAEQRYIYLPTEEDVPELMATAEGIPFYQTDPPD